MGSQNCDSFILSSSVKSSLTFKVSQAALLVLDRTELHSARNTKDFVTPFAVKKEERFMHPTLHRHVFEQGKPQGHSRKKL